MMDAPEDLLRELVSQAWIDTEWVACVFCDEAPPTQALYRPDHGLSPSEWNEAWEAAHARLHEDPSWHKDSCLWRRAAELLA